MTQFSSFSTLSTFSGHSGSRQGTLKEKAAVRENAIRLFWRGQAAGHIGVRGLTNVGCKRRLVNSAMASASVTEMPNVRAATIYYAIDWTIAPDGISLAHENGGLELAYQGGHNEIRRGRHRAGILSYHGSGAGGRNNQDRLYRSSLGRRRIERRGRPQDLPVSRRRDQRLRRPSRQEGRNRRAGQQDQSAGEPDSGAKSRRPGHPHHHPGERLFSGRGPVRLGQQIQ